MFTYIDNYIIIALAVAIPVVWAMIMGWNRFISNKKDLAIAQKNAKINNTEVADTVNAELGAKYWYGFGLLGIIGAVICAFIGLFVADVLAGRLYIAGEEEIALAGVGIAFVLEIVADAKIINKLGDSAFFVSKEEEAIDQFCNTDATVADEEAKPKTEAEQIAQLLTAILSKKN